MERLIFHDVKPQIQDLKTQYGRNDSSKTNQGVMWFTVVSWKNIGGRHQKCDTQIKYSYMNVALALSDLNEFYFRWLGIKLFLWFPTI